LQKNIEPKIALRVGVQVYLTKKAKTCPRCDVITENPKSETKKVLSD